jgi:hypothetical protein
MVALNNKYFGSERLQEHYYHMVKTTLICEQEQIYKLATFNVRMYNRTASQPTCVNHIPSEWLLPTTSVLPARVVGGELVLCMAHNRC